MRSTPSSPTRERTGVRAATVADASQILAVQARTWDAAYRGLLPDRALPRADDPQRLAFWRSVLMTGRTAARVATTRDGAVVGFSTGGPARDRALGTDQEIHTLYVLPEHQGAGLGRKLFRRTVAVLQARGGRSVGLWMLAANAGGERFYQRLGGRRGIRQTSTEAGVAFDEVAFVWNPITNALVD